MKKLTALFLTLALLISAAAIPVLAEEGKSTAWPVIELKRTPAELMSEGIGKEFRYQTFSGPGKGYSESGAYLPSIVTAEALFRENGFALIDVDYGVGRRCVYLQDKYVVGAEVEEMSFTPVKATTKTTIKPMYYGPGNQYEPVTHREKSKYADTPLEELMEIFDGNLDKIRIALQDVFPPVELRGGSRVSVLFEVNGWVCIESDCTILGLARSWIPADQVEAE